MEDVHAALAFFEADGPFLLTTHVNADGDGLGAVLALSHWLDKIGRPNQIVVNDQTPDPKFRFLPGFDRIVPFDTLDRPNQATHAVVVDTPTMTDCRIGHVAHLIGPKTRTLVIDHHAGETDEGDVQLIDSTASAASELVYHTLHASKTQLDEAITTCLYAGIAFDTKLFKYSNPHRALVVCAELAQQGADPQKIAEELFSHQTFETVKTLGSALSTLTLHAEGQVSTLFVDHETYVLGGDLDVVVDHAMSIDGVEVALFFKEETPGKQRVSLRSRGRVDVNRVARQFDGGGHQRASGCTIAGPLEAAQSQLLAAVEKHLE